MKKFKINRYLNLRKRNFGFAQSRPASRKSSAAYTIIEVMIVLSISAVLFVSATSLFAGQNQRTSFEQSVQDASSEISTRIKDVGSSQLLNDRGLKCQSTGSPKRASLSTGGTTDVGNAECLVIGTAVEALTGSNNLYFYTVLGNRLNYNVGGTALGLATSLAEAKPTPAVSTPPNPQLDLIIKYKFNGDVKVKSSNAVTGANLVIPSSLLGFYINFVGEGSSQNAYQGVAESFYEGLPDVNHDPTEVKKCIEQITAACSSSPKPAAKWSLCLENNKGDRRAQIDITSLPAGVTADVKFVNCT